jgi:hypothetical protein
MDPHQDKSDNGELEPRGPENGVHPPGSGTQVLVLGVHLHQSPVPVFVPFQPLVDALVDSVRVRPFAPALAELHANFRERLGDDGDEHVLHQPVIFFIVVNGACRKIKNLNVLIKVFDLFRYFCYFILL